MAVPPEPQGTGDENVLTRGALVLTLASLVAGCSGDVPSLAGYAATPELMIATPAVASVPMPLQQLPYRKTMSDRVLAAIALERVTGLKPDPGRLAE